jgi:AcrR family transcriptional regulator
MERKLNPKEIPGGNRMERKKEETKQKIIRAALSAFKTRGFDATTMEQIAADADIAKGTLYNYFPVKEAIIDEHMKRLFQERSPDKVQQALQAADTRARMRLVFADLLRGAVMMQDFFMKYIIYRFQILVSFQQEDSERSGMQLVTDEMIRLGQASGELRSDLPFYILQDLCEFAFIEAVKEFYLSPQTFDAAQAVERSVDLFMNGAQKRM